MSDQFRTPSGSAARPGGAGTLDPCDVVAERVALGEPLGDLAEHATSCAKCRRLAALPTELGVVTSEADPGLGFTARMTSGAQHLLVVRQRRRIVAAAVSAAAAASLLTFALTRQPAPATQSAQPALDMGSQREPEQVTDDEDDDLRALVQLADTDRNAAYSADWSEIEKPLAPYASLVKGVQP
jgi:hypothetical protein